MKTTFRNLIIAAVAAGFILGVSSCEKHTCPTYSQTEVNQAGARA